MQTRAGGGWQPWAYVKEVLEHSCKVFFFYFVFVGSYKRTCQGCKCLEGYISSSYAVVCSETIHSILEYLGATLVMQSHHSILLHKNALWPLTHHQSPRTRLNLWETQLLQNFLYTVWVVPAGICPNRVVTARAWLRIWISRERSGGFCVAGSWHQNAMGTVEQLGRYGGEFRHISRAGKCVHVLSFRLQTIPGSTHHQMIVNPVHSKWIVCLFVDLPITDERTKRGLFIYRSQWLPHRCDTVVFCCQDTPWEETYTKA